MQVHNFGAGPSILPREVIEQSAAGVLNFNDSGMSILEISHRSELFEKVLNEAISLVRELLNVPENYHVLFLSGGASFHFTMVPQNLMKTKAAYVESGVWAKKAIKESQLFGDTKVIASSADKNFTYLPAIENIPADADYLHCTSNNTIYGSQMKSFPVTTIPLVCDMSSDFLSRPVDVSQFGMIYAGAQKNVGPSGTSIVIIRNDLLDGYKTNTPIILRYKTHVDANSLYNTPPVFAIYTCMLTLRWLKKLGGLKAMEAINNKKAELLYNALESNSLFNLPVAKADRSYMNVVFTIDDKEKEKAFLDFCKSKNIVGIKGHKSVGGFRASIYNALPIDSVQFLVDVIAEFTAQ
ncbi:MAG TPA: 3-phosphoserine/phosphohydroxythreonine transaminase [Bacteroidia bacterium]|nr:3-phosphoserine/phosphohydroxythreonine transaminase [Bacteroidia bacterium]